VERPGKGKTEGGKDPGPYTLRVKKVLKGWKAMKTWLQIAGKGKIDSTTFKRSGEEKKNLTVNVTGGSADARFMCEGK